VTEYFTVAPFSFVVVMVNVVPIGPVVLLSAAFWLGADEPPVDAPGEFLVMPLPELATAAITMIRSSALPMPRNRFRAVWRFRRGG
jgi:hypothetical protein